jgi:thiol:disulfide interchange protein DsbC
MTEPVIADTSQQQEIQKIRQQFSKIEEMEGVEVTSITPSEVAGLYEVMLGNRPLYVSPDGQYVLAGRLYNIANGNFKDLTAPKVAQANKGYIESMNEKDMAIFSNQQYDHTVTIFTDIDCSYCRKLHAEMDDYNKLGIRVRYVMFPRAGEGSSSYEKAVSAFCSEDRNTALTKAKAGEKIPKKSCDNHPLREHMALAKLLGVNATPTIFFENGAQQPGYVPARNLKDALMQLEKASASQPKAAVQ